MPEGGEALSSPTTTRLQELLQNLKSDFVAGEFPG
jgi:hypothetical protein